MGARLLVQVLPQLPGSGQRIKPKDPEEHPGKLQPKDAREPHERTPDRLAKTLASARHAFARAPGLLGSSCCLLNRLLCCWRAGHGPLRTGACTLYWPRLRCRCGTRIRRRCRVRSSYQRFCSGPRSYPKRPPKAYRIHIAKCSRSCCGGKDASTIKRNPATPHPSRKNTRKGHP